MSVLKRNALEIATLGDAYWTADTMTAVGQWYLGMDMRPRVRCASVGREVVRGF